ncbi:MAG: SEC-C metal-binding domain-containing protein, partial [Selenomonadaceae bacterium]
IIKSEMDQYANEKLYPEEWTLDGLIEDAEGIYAPKGKLHKEELEDMSRDELKETLEKIAEDSYKAREQEFTEPVMRELEKIIMLRVVDNHWMEHLDHMDMLRQGINLQAYGQKNPLVQYKLEGYNMFEEMISQIQTDIAKLMYKVSIVTEEERKVEDRLATAQASHGDETSAAEANKKPVKKAPVRAQHIGRNDPCPCGSGKKYKNCCGKNK